jgi:hypothetical protein
MPTKKKTSGTSAADVRAAQRQLKDKASLTNIVNLLEKQARFNTGPKKKAATRKKK